MNVTELQEFNSRLEREFGDRYRLRWSPRREEYHLEQKVGVSEADAPLRLTEGDDTLERARAGYFFIMAIRPGDRAPCPGVDFWTGERCTATLRVPIKVSAEVTCEKCLERGRKGRYGMAYFPLGDDLIQWIRSIDFSLGHNKEWVGEMDAANQKLLRIKDNDVLNEVDAISSDLRKTIGAIEQVGYGGSIIRPIGNTSY